MNIPAPTIDDRTSLLLFEQGKTSTWKPAATGSPSLWELVNAPAGITINASTGEITIASSTEAGVHGFVVRATNFVSYIFTADISSNELEIDGHPFVDGDRLIPVTSDTLPAPLVADASYYARDVVAGNALRLATVAGGPLIDLTDTGTGTHTIKKPQSFELSVIVGIAPSTSRISGAPTDSLALEVDMDIVTRRVSVLGSGDYISGLPLLTQPVTIQTPPVITLKQGETFSILFGITRNSVLQDVDVKSIALASRELYGNRKITLTSGGFKKVGSGASTRYLGRVTVPQAVNAILSNNDEEIGAQVDIAGEFVVEYYSPVADPIDEETSTALVLVGGRSGSSKFSGTLSIGGLPVPDTALTFTLDIALDVTGRPSQDCSSLLTLDLTWNPVTSVFDVSNISGALTDSGNSDGDNWRVESLTIGTIAGSSGGIDIPWTISTTDDANQEFAQINVPTGFVLSPDGTALNIGVPSEFKLYKHVDGDEVEIDGFEPSTYIDAAALVSDFLSNIEDIEDIDVTYGVGTDVTLVIHLKDTSEAEYCRFGAGFVPGDIIPVTPKNISGSSAAATLSATLTQITAVTKPLNLRRSDTVTVRFLDAVN